MKKLWILCVLILSACGGNPHTTTNPGCAPRWVLVEGINGFDCQQGRCYGEIDGDVIKLWDGPQDRRFTQSGSSRP